MLILGTRALAPEHQQLHTLLEFLETEYPIPAATIKMWYDYNKPYYEYKGNRTTGLATVEYNTKATINVAAKNRSPRAVALSTAHEYMHCIQFIVRDLFVTESNKEALEDEAITFAEDVLVRLWKEQQIFYPSS